MTTRPPCFLAIALLLVLASSQAALAASPDPFEPGESDPCIFDPAACPLEISPPAPPPQIVDPFEPMFFGLYKVRAKKLLKHEASEAFEPSAPAFPHVVFETPEGFHLPLEMIFDPIQGKAKLVFEPTAGPILEGWLAKRFEDLLGGPVTVVLTKAPKVKVREKKNEDYQIAKLKLRGTLTFAGEEVPFRYRSAVFTMGMAP